MIKLTPDMESMLDIFTAECTELCTKMSDVLGNALFSAENINELFRIVHTLKGSSGLMGIDTLASLSHTFEDILHIFREDGSILPGRQENLTDLLYAYLDFVSDDLSRLADPKTYVAGDPQPLIEAAQTFMAELDETVEPTSPSVKPTPSASTERHGAHHWVVRFSNDCAMPAARAILLVRHISPLCTFLHHEPEDFFKDPDRADEQIRNKGLCLDFDCTDPDAIIRTITESSEVLSCNQTVSETPKTRPETPEAPAQIRSESHVNVSISKIDAMQQLVMELSAAHHALEKQMASSDTQQLDLLEQQQKIIRSLEEAIIFAGMSPLDRIRPQVQRMVHDISRELGKQVTLETSGGEIEVDHSLLERLPQFLPHLLRNAMDHGIEPPEERIRAGKPETGTIRILCEHHGNEILLTISDDGRGMNHALLLERAQKRGLLSDKKTLSDEDILELVLLPGFSTKETPSTYSGRGVGMDAVQDIIGDMGGRLQLSSTEGVGTSIRISLPISLALVESLLFSAGGISFLLPVLNVRHIDAFRETWAERVRTKDTVILRNGEYMPLIRLDTLCERLSTLPDDERILMIVEGVRRTACLVVDTLSGTRKVLVRGLPTLLADRLRTRTGIMGFGVMGDGTLAYMLSAEALIQASATRRNDHE